MIRIELWTHKSSENGLWPLCSKNHVNWEILSLFILFLKRKKEFFFIFLVCRPNEPVYFGQAFNGLDELVKSFKMIFYAKHGIKKMLNYAKDSHFLCFLFLKAWLWCKLKKYVYFFLVFCFLFVITHAKKIKSCITHLHFLLLIITHTLQLPAVIHSHSNNTNNTLNHTKSKMNLLECWNWLKLLKPKQGSCWN